MKTETDTYVISDKGEQGTFFVRTGERYGNTWLQLTIQSTFGTFGYTFGAIGGTAAAFLSDVSRDYLMGKLMGDRSTVFDAEKAAKSVREIIVEHRKRGELAKDEARTLWEALADAVGDHSNSEDRFFQTLADEPLFIDWEVWNVPRHAPCPQAVGFWRDLWPTFLAELVADSRAVAA